MIYLVHVFLICCCVCCVKSRILCLSVPANLLYFHLYFVLLLVNKSIDRSFVYDQS